MQAGARCLRIVSAVHQPKFIELIRFNEILIKLRKPNISERLAPRPIQTQTWDRVLVRHSGGSPQIDLRTRAGPAPDVDPPLAMWRVEASAVIAYPQAPLGPVEAGIQLHTNG